jgi:His/Glu/Gln/Arg/opine family amino acid ABC transporter permease subunit
MPAWVEPVAEYMLRVGLPETLRLAAVAVVGSTIIGIVLGTLITVRFLPLRTVIRLYIEVWRGLPIVVTIFLIYYALPNAPTIPQLGRFTGAAIGLTLWGSAQVAEATRGAVQSIPREQHEAAAALGFGWLGRQRSVILPQALRRLLPPLVSLQANVIQNTTIASLIGVTELLATGQRSAERLQFTSPESHAFAIYTAVLVAFFCISFPLTRLALYLERRLV